MSKKYYDIDPETGKITLEYTYDPRLATVIHVSPPPTTMLEPCWISGTWQDAATRSEHEVHIDSQTSSKIKKWCRARGKNEEYFINLGLKILLEAKINKTDIDTTSLEYRHYQEYRDYVATQKNIAKTKKEALQ